MTDYEDDGLMLNTTPRYALSLALATLMTTVPGFEPQAMAQEADIAGVIDTLNTSTFAVTDRNKSYITLFDAALDFTAAPSVSGGAGEDFNLNTIHPGMSNWQEVSDWAEANPAMHQAIIDSHHKLIIGLPYGREIDAKYLNNGMYADIAVNGNLRDQDFAYLDVMDTIAAYAVAEAYRLLEAGQAQPAVDFITAEMYVIDQFCERRFLTEKMHAMQMQIDFLSAVRDMMYLYGVKQQVLTIEQLGVEEYGTSGDRKKGLAFELPWLRVDMIEIPDGDAIVANELLKTVFAGDEADPNRFASVFATLQARDAAFTQFGAAKRWKMVAAFHSSKIDTQKRLGLVFGDWERRWGIRAWHPILEIDSQYDRTNPIRFAAVIYAMRDIGDIFPMRRQLLAAANGTSLAAAIVAYRMRHNTFPTDIEKVYATFVRKRFDVDPFDKDGGPFGYRYIGSSPVNVVTQNLGFISVTDGLLWARGQDFESQRGAEHSDDGLIGDIIYWPPLRAIAREDGG